ncbi:hypothetical protein ABKN59_007837 [Abortiporus biennis]
MVDSGTLAQEDADINAAVHGFIGLTRSSWSSLWLVNTPITEVYSSNLTNLSQSSIHPHCTVQPTKTVKILLILTPSSSEAIHRRRFTSTIISSCQSESCNQGPGDEREQQSGLRTPNQ